MKRVLLWLVPALLAPAAALGVTTQSFLIDTSDAFDKGKLEGTAVHTDGKVTRAIPTTRTPVDGAAVAYASAIGPDQAIYVSTGNQGQVYRVDDNGVRLFASTDAPLVSALVWVGDTLYAGTLEKGKVLAIDRKGQVKTFTSLTGAAHIWALAYDAKKAMLYAATGPEGKLFAIDKAGKAKLVHDNEAEHLLCLALDADGRMYIGTSNGARLLRIQGNEASVLYDAPGQELTALSLGAGFVAVASNEFQDAGGGGDLLKDVSTRARRGKAGKGKVFSVSFNGLVEELYHTDAAHITALEADTKQDAVLIGLGHEGRVVRVKKGQNQASWADADERQIVALHLTERIPHFLSSDGVALYRVGPSTNQALWTSAVLDAKAQARFGTLATRKKGEVTFRTRSGNTETPDPSWLPWSAINLGNAAVQSAPARFLQIEANLRGDAELYAIEAFYAPQNLPAYVRNVRANVERDKPAAAPGPTPSTPPKTQVTLNWDVDNPDADKLRYRLFYKRDGHEASLALLPEQEILDKTEQRWETVSLPDGYYRVRVVASDELSTPAATVTKHEATSAPILVDNHAPLIRELRLNGAKLSGQAEDALGPVALLELSLDGGFFRPIASDDGLFDTAHERFEIDLSALAPGFHVAAVRVTDGARNTNTSALEFTLKP
jgi:outer membrane protein assembly factor BamB